MKTCEMHEKCASPVTHLGEKGYIYCTKGAEERRGWERCRKMRAWELKWIAAGKALPSYKPGPEPTIEWKTLGATSQGAETADGTIVSVRHIPHVRRWSWGIKRPNGDALSGEVDTEREAKNMVEVRL